MMMTEKWQVSLFFLSTAIVVTFRASSRSLSPSLPLSPSLYFVVAPNFISCRCSKKKEFKQLWAKNKRYLFQCLAMLSILSFASGIIMLCSYPTRGTTPWDTSVPLLKIFIQIFQRSCLPRISVKQSLEDSKIWSNWQVKFGFLILMFILVQLQFLNKPSRNGAPASKEKYFRCWMHLLQEVWGWTCVAIWIALTMQVLVIDNIVREFPAGGVNPRVRCSGKAFGERTKRSIEGETNQGQSNRNWFKHTTSAP